VLIQSIETGLVILNADPYAYPMVTAAVILIAVLVDSARNTALSRLTQRRIRIEA
jgi:ribose transport system permease protein